MIGFCCCLNFSITDFYFSPLGGEPRLIPPPQSDGLLENVTFGYGVSEAASLLREQKRDESRKEDEADCSLRLQVSSAGSPVCAMLCASSLQAAVCHVPLETQHPINID